MENTTDEWHLTLKVHAHHAGTEANHKVPQSPMESCTNDALPVPTHYGRKRDHTRERKHNARWKKTEMYMRWSPALFCRKYAPLIEPLPLITNTGAEINYKH